MSRGKLSQGGRQQYKMQFLVSTHHTKPYGIFILSYNMIYAWECDEDSNIIEPLCELDTTDIFPDKDGYFTFEGKIYLLYSEK